MNVPTKKRNVSASLDRAAARRVLLDWAVSRHRDGSHSFSELAEETGLPVEEIMDAVGRRDTESALAMFLASCETVAEMQGMPEFLRLGQEAVQATRVLHQTAKLSS